MLTADMRLIASELGLDNGSGDHIYADVIERDGDLVAIVTLVDYSRFHTDRHLELTDNREEPWLSAEALAILSRLAAERFGAEVTSGDDGDEPHVSFVWEVHLTPAATAESIGSWVWPNVAAVLNETDPGTFGARYIYADVARELALVDLDFARDTLGPDAPEADVVELAHQRAARDAEEAGR